MSVDSLIFGLVPGSHEASPFGGPAPLRDRTIASLRSRYDGEILEAPSVDALLAEAAEHDASLCLIQSWGNTLAGGSTRRGKGPARLEDWIPAVAEGLDFLVMGPLIRADDGSHGIDDRCILVDLERYVSLGCPAFGDASGKVVERLVAQPLPSQLGRGATSVVTRVLQPAHARPREAPAASGWSIIDASLRAGLPVYDLSPVLDRSTSRLVPETSPPPRR